MDDTNKLIEQRRENLAALREAGIKPFANKFTPSENCGDAKANYTEDRPVAVAGRLVSKREMGKTIFAHIRDTSGTIQLFIRKNDIGDGPIKYSYMCILIYVLKRRRRKKLIVEKEGECMYIRVL